MSEPTRVLDTDDIYHVLRVLVSLRLITRETFMRVIRENNARMFQLLFSGTSAR